MDFARPGKESLTYPKSVWFIILSEFFERFSFYGIRATLPLYLKEVVNLGEHLATQIYHAFMVLSYFISPIGAILSDSFLGNYQTILYFTILYVVGSGLLAISAIPQFSDFLTLFCYLGLVLTAMGNGAIKPCVSTFGADQFILPQQIILLAIYFSIFHWIQNAGNVFAILVTPILRKDIGCFDEDSCYFLAFALNTGLLALSLACLLGGICWYKKDPPTGNILVKVTKCITFALTQRLKVREKKDHWLDFATEKFEARFIDDLKTVGKLLIVYIPIPIFWALYEQQGSRWTFQASRMDGRLGNYVIKPDQFQVINRVLILILIPIFDNFVYPFFAKFNLLKKPLQRMTVGGVLFAVSFILSGVVELQLESNIPKVIGSNEASLNLYNALPYHIKVNLAEIGGDLKIYNESLDPNTNFILRSIKHGNYSISVENSELKNLNKELNCQFNNSIQLESPIIIETNEKQMSSFMFLQIQNEINAVRTRFNEHLEKSKLENAFIRVVYADSTNNDSSPPKFLLKGEDSADHPLNPTRTDSVLYETSAEEISTDEWQIYLTDGSENFENDLFIGDIELEIGGSYLLSIIKKNETSYQTKLITIVPHNSLHMFWQLPQYVTISIADLMFQITGMKFSYNQAPMSMKSLLQSVWILTRAIGNLIVIIIAELSFFDKQSYEFFLFAGLMLVDMVIFAFVAYHFVPVEEYGTSFGKGKEIALMHYIYISDKSAHIDSHENDNNNNKKGKTKNKV